MTFQAIDQAKLAKVLALTESDQEAEALAALRSAQRILKKSGYSLAEWLGNRSPQPQMSFIQRDPRVPYLEQQVNRLRERLDEQDREVAERKQAVRELSHQLLTLRQELDMRTQEAKDWRNRAWSNLWLSQEKAKG